jgi:hypothetical protein
MNDLQTITLPSTSGAWTTVDAGTFSTTANSVHTVRLTILSGAAILIISFGLKMTLLPLEIRILKMN